jgi:hypothetical protein
LEYLVKRYSWREIKKAGEKRFSYQDFLSLGFPEKIMKLFGQIEDSFDEEDFVGPNSFWQGNLEKHGFEIPQEFIHCESFTKKSILLPFGLSKKSLDKI